MNPEDQKIKAIKEDEQSSLRRLNTFGEDTLKEFMGNTQSDDKDDEKAAPVAASAIKDK